MTKEKIGLVRFDKQNNSKCLVSINSNPTYRGQKLSSTLLKASIRNYVERSTTANWLLKYIRITLQARIFF